MKFTHISLHLLPQVIPHAIRPGGGGEGEGWGCAAGWGRIFTTGLTIMGSRCVFNIGTRMGSNIFSFLG